MRLRRAFAVLFGALVFANSEAAVTWVVLPVRSSIVDGSYWIEIYKNGINIVSETSGWEGSRPVTMSPGDTVQAYLWTLTDLANYDLELYDQFLGMPIDTSSRSPSNEPDYVTGTYGSSEAELFDDGEPYRSFDPQTVTPGETSFTVSTRVRNGGGSSAGAFDVDFYASTDTTISTTDYYIGSDFVSSLAAGSVRAVSWSGTFPSSVPAGTYYVGWIIDAGDSVVEINKSDNTAYKTEYQLTVPERPAPPPSGEGDGGCLPSRAGAPAATFAWLLPLALAAFALRRRRLA